MKAYLPEKNLKDKVILITGSAQRIGAEIVETLHNDGACVAIHYLSSEDKAKALSHKLNKSRPDSAAVFNADLKNVKSIIDLINKVIKWQGRLDGLVNNASTFYPTPVGTITEDHWDEIFCSNLKGPLFLMQAASPYLRKNNGNIVNIIDIYAKKPLVDHTLYCSAKAGLAMLTRSLAKELAPEIRVNGVSPGAIIWPENNMKDATKKDILRQIPLNQIGEKSDIAGCVLYLMRDAKYVTGQIIAIDGGRSIY
ncbi:MAG: pteridine reductase [Verrucomicrobiales bacterium]|nr:pteridine reductase [Verrucomicrobiales bacterium]